MDVQGLEEQQQQEVNVAGVSTWAEGRTPREFLLEVERDAPSSSSAPVPGEGLAAALASLEELDGLAAAWAPANKQRRRLPAEAFCQADGCGADLRSHAGYYQRAKICPTHAAADFFHRAGEQLRFCQQCGHGHELDGAGGAGAQGGGAMP